METVTLVLSASDLTVTLAGHLREGAVLTSLMTLGFDLILKGNCIFGQK